MLTLEKITAAARELPAEFSIDQLVAKLRYQEEFEVFEKVAKQWSTEYQASFSAIGTQPPVSSPGLPPAPPRPANLTPEQAAEWDYYTSPAARALYHKFPVSPEVEALRGIIRLSEENQHKSAKELLAEALWEKYGK